MLLPLVALLVLRPAPSVADLISFDASRARRADPTITVVPENDPALRRQGRRALAHALAKYPAGPLLRHLRAVYVVHDMTADGAAMGGTNTPEVRSIWVAVGQAPDLTDRWIEDDLHHELAHLLADTLRPSLPEKAWRAANAPRFRYTYGEGGGLTAVQSGRHTEEGLDAALNAQGLLSDYGATEFDEDWATYAERLMDPDPTFRAALRRYSRVQAKVRLMAAFYARALPGIRFP